MIIGFNLGRPCGLKIEEKVDIFKQLGCKAIEYSLLDVKQEERWTKLESYLISENDFSGFEFVTVHAPAKSFVYKNNEETKQVLLRLQKIYELMNFKHAVIHPDRIEDWGILKDCIFPIAIENMDHRKDVGRTINDLKEVFNKNDFPMVLDMNHCYVNDNTMKLAGDFYQEFGPRIKEIHLSGIEKVHDPLHETKQNEIINAIPNKDLPIIIESPVNDMESIKKEFDYITNNL